MNVRLLPLVALIVAGRAYTAEYRFTEAGMDRDFVTEDSEAGYRAAAAAAKLKDEKDIDRRAGFVVRQSDKAVHDNDAAPVLYLADQKRTDYTRRIVTEKVVVHTGLDLAELGKDAGATKAEASFAVGYGILTFATPEAALAAADKLRADGVDATPMLARQRSKHGVPNDTLFPLQWHLNAADDWDIDAPEAWDYELGNGISIAIVDDGVQLNHEDLAPNAPLVSSGLHHDFNDGDDDPSPDMTVDDHGTAVAGCADARGNNGIGVSGSSQQSRLLALRLIAGPTTDQMEADAMNWGVASGDVDVSNNSWGVDDDGETVDGPGPLTQAALLNGVTNGRGGKGVIYVWAAGNGGDIDGGPTGEDDNSNFDGYANSPYTIAVGAVAIGGNRALFSEPGANIVVSAPGQEITTTDLDDIDNDHGYNTDAPGNPPDWFDKGYTQHFEGSSAAAPIVSGVVALMLDENPNLGWRDVQEILMLTATKNDPSHTSWFDNGAGFHFNHFYGAGLVNARDALLRSTNWSNLGARLSVSRSKTVNLTYQDNEPVGVTTSFDFTGLMQLRVEHVQVAVNITNQWRGDVIVELISPAGTVSQLTTERKFDATDNLVWTLMTVQNWGEMSQGVWKMHVYDGFDDTSVTGGGTFVSATITIFGTHNSPPVAANDTDDTDEDTALHIRTSSLLQNDTDPDNDTLRITRVDSPTHGTVSLSGTTITFTPSLNYNGPATFRYTVSDGHGGTDRGTVTITVNPVPDAPIITINSPDMFDEFDFGIMSLTIDATATDPDGDPITSFTMTDGSGPPIAAPFTFNGTLGGGEMASGTYTFNAAASDGTLTGYASVTVTVKGAHPTITSTPDLHAHFGTAYSYSPQAADGPIANWAISNQPAGMVINAGTGVVDWPAPTGPGGVSGHVSFQIRAETATGFDTQEVLLYVSHLAGITSR